MHMKNRIKVCRAELDITQEDLAKRINSNASSVALIEGGRHQPSVFLAFRIADALGKDINDVFKLVKEDN